MCLFFNFLPLHMTLLALASYYLCQQPWNQLVRGECLSSRIWIAGVHQFSPPNTIKVMVNKSFLRHVNYVVLTVFV